MRPPARTLPSIQVGITDQQRVRAMLSIHAHARWPDAKSYSLTGGSRPDTSPKLRGGRHQLVGVGPISYRPTNTSCCVLGGWHGGPKMGGGGRIQHPVADRNSTSTHKRPKAVFFDKGAQTYYGYDYTVHTDFAASTALQLFTSLVQSLLDTGDAFESVHPKRDDRPFDTGFVMSVPDRDLTVGPGVTTTTQPAIPSYRPPSASRPADARHDRTARTVDRAASTPRREPVVAISPRLPSKRARCWTPSRRLDDEVVLDG